MKTDQRLQADVEQELRWDPSVRSEDIGVSVTGGVVQLDGHVDSYFGRWAAERAAMRVSDAKAVASDEQAAPVVVPECEREHPAQVCEHFFPIFGV